LTNAQVASDRQIKNQFVVVMEEGGGSHNGGGPYGGGETKKHKPGKRVQFTVVPDHENYLIVDVKIH
jgi:hypothetical protein